MIHDISIFFKHTNDTKDMYNILLNENYVKPSGMLKWNDMFNLSEQQWSKIIFLPFMCTEDTQLRWFQSGINHKILGNNYILHKMKIVQDS